MPAPQTPPQTTERSTAAPMMVRAAEIRPASYQEADNSIEIVWTTGAAGMRFDWMDGSYYMEELSVSPGAVRLDFLNTGACLLDSHQDYTLGSVLGSVVPGSASVDGKQGIARVRLATTPDVADTNAKIIAGHIRSVSVGYNVYTYQRTEQPGEYPHMLATDWEPVELSMVVVPFDTGAQVRARSASQGGTHPCIVRGDAAASKENIMPDPVIEPAADPAPAPVVAPAADPAPAPAIDNAQRHASIELITRRAKPQGSDFVVELVERHAAKPMTELEVEQAINDRYARSNNPPAIDNTIRVGADADDKWIEGAVHGIIARAGLAPLVEKAARLNGETLKITPGEFRGVRLASLAAEGLARNGVKAPSRSEDQVVEMALRHAQQTRTAVITQGTSDFAVVLENTMNKVLQAAYMVAPDTWKRWCKTGSLSDFRDGNRYILGTFGALDAVGETGEIKNKPIPDGAREKIRLGTKANMINLSRNAIINDDLGAFSDLATMLGRAAKLSIERDAYALLNSNPIMASDGQPLFSAAHGNIAAVGAPPTVVGIDAMRVQMAQQMDLSGNEILDLAPSIWLGPLGLGSLTRVINDSVYDPDANNKLQRANPVSKIFDDVIDTGRLTGTPWYMLADVDAAPTFEVAFLNGDQEPKVDSQDGWRTLGVEWRVVFDYGLAAINWRSIIKNNGA